MHIASVAFLSVGLALAGSDAALAQAARVGSGAPQYYEAVTRDGRATQAPRGDCRRIQSNGRSLWQCPAGRVGGPAAAAPTGMDIRPDRDSSGY